MLLLYNLELNLLALNYKFPFFKEIKTITAGPANKTIAAESN